MPRVWAAIPLAPPLLLLRVGRCCPFALRGEGEGEIVCAPASELGERKWRVGTPSGDGRNKVDIDDTRARSCDPSSSFDSILDDSVDEVAVVEVDDVND